MATFKPNFRKVEHISIVNYHLAYRFITYQVFIRAQITEKFLK